MFAPLILVVNTESGNYSMRLSGILKIRIVPDEELFHIRVRIFLVPFIIDPFRTVQKEVQKEVVEKDKKKVLSSSLLKALKELIQSFRVKRLYVDLDTENYLLNAYLYPAFMFLRSDRIQCFTNFEERNTVILDLRNRLARLLWIGIKYQYRSYVKP
jgi:hypothetical protein